jgi:16S rRNA (adenine1518-N6/adenine1519-N6)-dimethyltransferase
VEHYPKKRLGQHFLTDHSIAKRIVGALETNRSDPILEIGPGRGILTDFLVELGKPVFAVEKDNVLASFLEDKYGDVGSFRIISGDILEMDLRALLREEGAASASVIGNIPFQITSPILSYLLDHRDVIEDTVIMIQKEVADRIVASPGGRVYGGISVILSYYASVKFLFKVSGGSFHPPPDVDASVLKISFNGFSLDMKAEDEDFFLKVVRTLFGWRRKQVQKILKTHPDIGLSQEKLDILQGRLTFALSGRPEDLSVSDFVHLANELLTLCKE